VLQHGTFPLYGDISRIVNYLVFPNEASRQDASDRLKGRALTAQDACGDAITWGKAADAFESAFKDRLNIDLHHETLSSREEYQVNQLMVEKYANPEWTDRISI
jgi:lipoate-protein ligase A